MNWSQFKDSASHMCLAGTVVAPWFLTQEGQVFNDKYFLSLNSLNLVKKFMGNSIMCHHKNVKGRDIMHHVLYF